MADLRVPMTVTQARKLSDLLNRADWHATRRSMGVANDYYEECFALISGVRPPESDCAVKRLCEQLVIAERADVPSSFSGKLRSLGVEALEEVERSLYIPLGKSGEHAAHDTNFTPEVVEGIVEDVQREYAPKRVAGEYDHQFERGKCAKCGMADSIATRTVKCGSKQPPAAAKPKYRQESLLDQPAVAQAELTPDHDKS